MRDGEAEAAAGKSGMGAIADYLGRLLDDARRAAAHESRGAELVGG